MWKCPKCETLNQGQTCVVCGEKEAVYQSVNFCPDCGNKIDNKIGYCKICTQNDKRYSYEQPHKSNQKNIIIVLCCVILGLIICLVGIFYYFVIHENNKTENEEIITTEEQINITTDKNTDENFIIVEDEKVQDNKSAESTEKLPRTAVENVENKVLTIRNWYNDTQSNLENLSTVKGVKGITEYYDKSSCVRIDVSADEKNSYNRYYYFKDNKLYFVFAFDGQKENRLYFYDEMLFRWIDESGIIHDNDFNSKEFISWEKVILNELAILQ